MTLPICLGLVVLYLVAYFTWLAVEVHRAPVIPDDTPLPGVAE